MRVRVIALCLLATVQLWAQKQFRPGESDLYNKVIADVNAGKFADAMADVELWKQKTADSDYNNERAALYVQACAGANEPTKALDAAGPLLALDLNTLFEGAQGQAMQIRLLYNVAWAIAQVPNPTPQQVSTAEKAARQLIEYDKPLPGVGDAKWAEARADMKQKAASALFYLAMLPGYRAMASKPPDCKAAEAAYTKALVDWPDKAAVSWELGRALSCEAKEDPARFVLAIYHFQRAAALDPTLGDPRNDPAKIRAFADNAYVKYHGNQQGLDQLRAIAKQSPLPPGDFSIQSASEAAAERQKAFEQEHPQVALWMKIRDRLSAPDGKQYFESELKDTAVPPLMGALIAATPSCHSRELSITITRPDDPGTRAEITLRLDKPLSGRPDLPQEIQWEGVPSAFTQDPFMLTMNTVTATITGLKLTPCSVAPPQHRRLKM